VGHDNQLYGHAWRQSAARRLKQTLSEPEPGRALVEAGSGSQATFTVEPRGAQCLVRFATLLEARGLAGLLTRLFAPRLLQPLYAEEFERLEQHARAHQPLATQSSEP